jgi:hypothetical protein
MMDTRSENQSGLASTFKVLAFITIVASLSAAAATNYKDGSMAWIACGSGVLSGLFLLGFASIIESLVCAKNSLRAIEKLLEQQKR